MMENDTARKFATFMAILGTAFGENGMPKARAEIYYEHLRDIPIDAVGKAVSTILKTRKYSSIPTIAEIREAALGRDDEIETAALKAWGEACYIAERGLYEGPDCRILPERRDGTSLIDEAVMVAFGGWPKLGQTDPDNAMADRAHFLKVFKGLARSRRDRGGFALEAHRPAALPRGQEIVDDLVKKLGK